MYDEKTHWLMILQKRKEYFLYGREPRNFDAVRQIREMQELIRDNKVKDYSMLEDFGIEVEMSKIKGQLITT
jgi:hypothetical protein